MQEIIHKRLNAGNNRLAQILHVRVHFRYITVKDQKTYSLNLLILSSPSGISLAATQSSKYSSINRL